MCQQSTFCPELRLSSSLFMLDFVYRINGPQEIHVVAYLVHSILPCGLRPGMF